MSEDEDYAQAPDRTFATYEEARAAAGAEMEAFTAALPGRMQEIADQLSGLLPDGMRFELAPVSEDQAPDRLAALGDSVALGFGDGIASAIRSAFGEQE